MSSHVTFRDRWIAPVDPSGFREGARAMWPFGVAISIWAFVTGVAMVNTGMPVAIGLVMTLTVFAGSAQLAVLPLLAAGAPLPLVGVTAMIVNLRFVIFAATSRPAFVRLSLRQRTLAGYLNGDLGFSLFSLRFAADPERGNPLQWGYFYGGAVVNWSIWQVASIAGLVLGGLAPASWGLEVAAYLALVAVLVPMTVTSPAIAGVGVAVVTSLVTVQMPLRLGLIVSVVAGVGVALLVERVRDTVVARRVALGEEVR
jgi:predicted branched-subunit amino acid permease